jgi:hypothetical protein
MHTGTACVCGRRFLRFINRAAFLYSSATLTTSVVIAIASFSQVHWRFFQSLAEAVYVSWKKDDLIEKWSIYGLRRLHSDLSVLEAFADRCQLDMVACGVYEQLGLEIPPARGPRVFDLKEALAEARQVMGNRHFFWPLFFLLFFLRISKYAGCLT